MMGTKIPHGKSEATKAIRKSARQGGDATAKVLESLKDFRTTQRERDSYIARHSDPDGGEPNCGYPRWDEAMSDYARDLSDDGERLADAIDDALRSGQI